MTKQVIYSDLYGNKWMRTGAEFNDGRVSSVRMVDHKFNIIRFEMEGYNRFNVFRQTTDEKGSIALVSIMQEPSLIDSMYEHEWHRNAMHKLIELFGEYVDYRRIMSMATLSYMHQNRYDNFYHELFFGDCDQPGLLMDDLPWEERYESSEFEVVAGEKYFCPQCNAVGGKADWRWGMPAEAVYGHCDNCGHEFFLAWELYLDANVKLVAHEMAGQILNWTKEHWNGYDSYPFCASVKWYGGFGNGRTYNGVPLSTGSRTVNSYTDIMECDGVTRVYNEDENRIDYYNDPALDEAWEEWSNSDGREEDLYDMAREDWWSSLNDYTLFHDCEQLHKWFPELKHKEIDCKYSFCGFGRSGGWLVLDEFEGGSFFRKRFEFADLVNMNTESLRNLYSLAYIMNEMKKGLNNYAKHYASDLRSEWEYKVKNGVDVEGMWLHQLRD